MNVSLHQVQKIVFKNGLSLLLLPQKESTLCAIHLCLMMGNIFEGENERGLSALLQESILKGTQSKDAITFNQEVEMLGASIESSSNYFTGKIAIEGPNSNFQPLLSLFFEVIKSPALISEEIEKEKNFLLGILDSLDDDPLKAAMLRFKKGFYGTHPYGSPTIGEKNSLKTFTDKQVVSWYHRWYVPNNMAIAVVGDFHPEEVKDLFLREVGDVLPLEIPSLSSDGFYPVSLKIIDRKDIRDSWVVLGYRAPSLMDVKERVAFEILSNCLGGGMYSRLFLKIREELGLSYEVGSAYAPFIGPSFLCAYAGFPYSYFERVIALFREEFHHLVKMGDEEFNEAKNYTRGVFLNRFETVYSISSLISFYERVGLGWEFPFQYENIIRSMSREDTLTIYRKYLGEGETLGAVVPSHPETIL